MRCWLLAALALAGAVSIRDWVASAHAVAPRLVRLASSPGLAGKGTVIGAVEPSTSMHVTVVLKPRDAAGLARFARQVSDPGSPQYRNYLTPTQFGARFGASAGELNAVRAALAARGLKPGPNPPNRLSIPVTATAGALERAFSIRLQQRALAHGARAVGPSAAPAVDSRIAGFVQSVVGLSGSAAPHPLLLRPRGRRLAVPQARPHVQTGGTQPCPSASTAASQSGAYTADQIASAYGFSGLYGDGDQGQGVTIAEYELEPNDPADIAAYQACYGTHASVSYVQVGGGAGSGPGSGEAALDIENAIGLAPRANYLVYQGPNANQSVPGSGPYDLFSAIINQDRANVISVSWGQCEQLEGASGAQAEETLFAQAAAEGQTIVSASGDQGSEDCNGANNVPNPQLAVDDPSSQPFVTSVGGTSMSQLGPPPTQGAWNDGGNVTALTGVQLGAGGGGVSTFWTMPGYQSTAAPGLGVIGSNSSRSPCGAPTGYCRQIPDVAADADPNTGYVIYWNGSGSDPTAPAGWQTVGGTSGAAPVWAAVMALADGASACHGSPLGFANPALYKAASSDYAGQFSDVTAGNNDFTGTNGGKYSAGPGYDMATGLGSPNAAALVPSLCADTLRIRYPGPVRSALGRRARLRLSTTGPVGGTLSFAGSGLPPGLRLSSGTGQISGVAKKLGSYTVVVVVSDSTLAVRGVAFPWIVQGSPKIASPSLTGLRTGRPRLRLTVLAGRGAPGLSSVTVRLPGALRWHRPPPVLRGAGGQRIGFRARIRGASLSLTLNGAPRRITLSAAYPGISLFGPGARRNLARPTLRVGITDTHGFSLSLSVTARSGH